MSRGGSNTRYGVWASSQRRLVDAGSLGAASAKPDPSAQTASDPLVAWVSTDAPLNFLIVLGFTAALEQLDGSPQNNITGVTRPILAETACNSACWEHVSCKRPQYLG